MRRKTAAILGVSGAALALTASSAFTAGGLTKASGVTGFLGGSKAITVTGTEISSMVYNDDTDTTKIASIDFTFSNQNAVGKVPTIAFSMSSGSAPTGWTCDTVVTSGSTDATTNCHMATSSGNPLDKATVSTVTLTVA